MLISFKELTSKQVAVNILIDLRDKPGRHERIYLKAVCLSFFEESERQTG